MIKPKGKFVEYNKQISITAGNDSKDIQWLWINRNFSLGLLGTMLSVTTECSAKSQLCFNLWQVNLVLRTIPLNSNAPTSYEMTAVPLDCLLNDRVIMLTWYPLSWIYLGTEFVPLFNPPLLSTSVIIIETVLEWYAVKWKEGQFKAII